MDEAEEVMPESLDVVEPLNLPSSVMRSAEKVASAVRSARRQEEGLVLTVVTSMARYDCGGERPGGGT